MRIDGIVTVHVLVLYRHCTSTDIGNGDAIFFQTTADLQAADEDRKKDFKEYELDKEHRRREKLKSMDERSRAEEDVKFKDMKEKHAQHPNLHHPVSISSSSYQLTLWRIVFSSLHTYHRRAVRPS